MRPSSAIATLRYLASLNLPPAMTQSTVSLLLRDVVPSDTSTILWFDQDCNLRDLYSNHLCPRDLGHRFTSHYLNRQEMDAYVPHGQFLRGKSRFDLLHSRANFQKTMFYDEFAQPMGFGRIARLAIRRAGVPVGAIWLTRATGDRDFSKRELIALLEAGAYAEHVLVAGSDDTPCDTANGEKGLLISDLNGVVQYVTEGTEGLLHLAAGMPRDAIVLSIARYEWARPLLSHLAQRIATLENGQKADVPLMVVHNTSGSYSLRASRMRGPAGEISNLISVQITRHIPLILRLLELPQVRALPSREKQACLLLLEGRSTREIALRMGVSNNAIVQHIRSLYNRLDIHRREDLLAALTQGNCRNDSMP
jgi:DNA-binding CsgD family transcriptional regulator